MTAEEEKIIHMLEARTRQLIDEFDKLKAKNAELHDDIVAKDNELQAALKRYSELETDYANLKMARVLMLSDNDISQAKSRVTKMVREVDKCIALLKAMEPGE